MHGTGAPGAGASHAGAHGTEARGTKAHDAGAHGTEAQDTGARGAEGQAGGGVQAPVPAEGAVDATMTLRAVQPGAAAGAAGTGAATAAVSGLPTPLAPGTARPNADDLGLFDDATRPLRHVPAGAAASRQTDGEPPRRSRLRRGALIAASGAVVVVLGAAGWASGLFSYDSPSRDDAAPDDIRASVPDQPSGSPSAEPSPGASSASPSASPSASDSPSAGASASASPSPSASSSAPSASAPAEPSATASTGAASSAPAVAPEPSDPGGTAPVLRRGDRGPEVTELQQRLRQVWLYHGDIHGQYTPRVEEAVRAYQWSRGIAEEMGVYGPQTRARLEAETQG
ncbi:peptidoglycan-binding domain-containing protein [Streptomyces sp. NPDC006147]|uniref:peptidoglycan-binding domain-containing protein n=1 Tax=Streptomyces sp. NPDC006147 TaxID=3155597 RepID=UPI0033BE1399